MPHRNLQSEPLEARVLFAAGLLDTTFSDNGRISTGVLVADFAKDVAVQANGRIVVAGNTWDGGDQDIALVRYTKTGDLDSVFGPGGPEGAGKVVQDFNQFDEVVTSVAIQTDGKILVAGQTESTLNTIRSFVARFNKDGSIDAQFGNNGFVLIAFGTNNSIIEDIALQKDGAIVAVAKVEAADFKIGVARITPVGALDSSFYVDGFGLLDAGASFDQDANVAIQTDGKILIACLGDSDAKGNGEMVLMRVDPKTSTLDLDFGENGKAYLELDDDEDEHPAAVAVAPSGRIVVSGWVHDSGFVALFDPSGELIESRLLDIPDSDDVKPADVAFQPNGMIVVAGTYEPDVDEAWFVQRFESDLQNDATFNAEGLSTGRFGTDPNDSSTATAMAIQRDGQIVLAGTLAIGNIDFAAARLHGYDEDAASITGRVFVDRNANGTQQKNDKGVPGIRVFLDIDRDKNFDRMTEPSVLSDANGLYTLPGLAADTYRVRQIVQKRFAQTAPTPAAHAVTVVAGQNAKGRDFGLQSLGVISGFVFEDANFSFTRDDDEEGLEGFTVFIDKNENGVRDDDEIFVKTDADGAWKFTDLNPGTYIIRVKLKSGYVATLGPDRQVELQPGGLSRGTLMGLNQTA